MMRNNLNRNGSRRHSFRGHINSPFLRHRFAETTGDSLLPSLREAAAALCRSADRETLCRVIELLQRADPRNKLPPAPEPPASRVASREALALQTQTLGLGERRRPSRSAGALATAAAGAADVSPPPPASPRGYAQMLTDAATSLTSGAAAFLSPGPARPPSPEDAGGEPRGDARDRSGSAGSKLGGDPEARRQRRVEALLGEIDAPGDRMRRASSTPLLSALAAPPAPSEDDGRGSPARQPSMSASCAMLRELARAPATVKLGLDLGGTLTKLVIATPVSDGGGIAAPRRAHERLRLHCDVGGVPMTLQFVSSSTGELEEVLTALGCSDDEDESARRISRRIVAAGGGAHKLRQTFRSALGIELTPFREMQSIVDGILLLHELGVDDELYTASDVQTGADRAAAVAERADGRPVFRPADPLRAARAAPRAPSSPPTVSDARACEALAHWPKPLLPLLLVNVGSGVSCLLVSREGYARVGGTALGGATFLGLARALTSATTFDEALALAAEGEAANVDTLVEDIYGSTGCVDLGLPPSLTAASFGKLSRADLRSTSDADVCRALLEMVAQSCCVLARAHAAQLGCRQRVFFAGGFVDENPLARATIANSLKSLGGKAHFLRHSDFLGALGATAHALDHAHAHKVSQLPGNPADPAKDDDPRSPTSLRPPRKSANLARGASAA